ncbi:VOC family protein [Saccharopolyspora sp. 6V]|uniref:VOC family protein n=1 Tax=Saccharopolyspora sp. 6V TaxID=2877239 RepID=UPI001CD51D0D|nr:VOC family protein [Saccharopolyspora sp. 6V]MCA1191080.1 VOC family protein [Saccharopolyspora sp. 6V]
MTDPFDALREPIVPAEPSPQFAGRLRDRLERALLDDRGVTMTDTESTRTGAAREQRVDLSDRVAMTLTPYLAVSDAQRAIDWYGAVLGARLRAEPYAMADGRLGHVELDVGGSALFLADEFPEIDMLAPVHRGGASTTLHVEVPDVDAVVQRAREHGATVVGDVEEHPYGRSGRFDDPFGHRWMIMTPPGRAEVSSEPAAPRPPRHGDIDYITIATPDTALAKEFYGAVLGWRFGPGNVEDGWQIEDVQPMAGMHGSDTGEVTLCFRTDDLEATLAEVRAHGGNAEEPADMPYGRLATCTDNQGRTFYLLGAAE